MFTVYESRVGCSDPDRVRLTLDSSDELQRRVEKWAAEHMSKDSGRCVLLASYATAVSRLGRPTDVDMKMVWRGRRSSKAGSFPKRAARLASPAGSARLG